VRCGEWRQTSFERCLFLSSLAVTCRGIGFTVSASAWCWVDCAVLALRITVFLQCVLLLTASNCQLQARQVLRWKNDKPVLAMKVCGVLSVRLSLVLCVLFR
jgi:hypothetical protein